MTTRYAFKIEEPFLRPGRVDFRAPDEGFGLEGTPKPKIQRDPSPQKGNLICGSPLQLFGRFLIKLCTEGPGFDPVSISARFGLILNLADEIYGHAVTM